tara:strand:- start:5398 stop:5820 length:423 start_codon:yes stop_codon:yes gene_type:complete
MKELLEYRDNFYFNNTDYFLALNNLNQFYLTELESHNGNWYPKTYREFEGGKLYDSGHWRTINRFYNKGCLQTNMVSMLTINCKELYGRDVHYIGTPLKGKITKFLLHNMGVNWYNGQGKLYKEFGFPYFWNEPKNLELI